MKQYIEHWKNMILKESGQDDQDVITEVSRYKEWDEPGEDFGKTYGYIRDKYYGWYGRGPRKIRDVSHADWSRDGLTPEKRAFKNWISRFGSRYCITNEEGKYIKVIKKDDQPVGYVWSETANATVPFKEEGKARRFSVLFANLPHLDGATLNPDGTTLKDEKLSFNVISKTVDGVGESCVNENNYVAGNRYDWTQDFVFPDSIIADLKARDLIFMGTYIGIILPVNRDTAPTYHKDGNGVIGRDGTIYKWDAENGGRREKADRHDYEPYDLLHITIDLDPKNKKLGIDRYFGHRKDYQGENFENTERDWTETPVLTRKTLDSLIDAFNRNGVFDGIVKAVEKDPSADAKYTNWIEGKAAFLKERAYGFSKDVVDGLLSRYEYDFFEPEIPTPEYQAKKLNDHETEVRRISKQLSDYYGSNFQGNNQYNGD